ncbi:PLP-dependent aspartate aminotransferase family protein [Olsenella uli]|uniref:trans-sulfuration enzyme family protein n=1 Tax=Olsenella uli TaxID=133926 RepID=UPI0012AB37D0|nr:PLP-dependent aspartate aminotransferase family protein [Olsenella uli]
MDFSTSCVHPPRRVKDAKGAIVPPLYLTSSFAHPGVGQSTGYDYSRLQNPTREVLEDTVRELEGGDDCLAFSSGMAAISCLMELFSPGDRLVASWDLYGGSIRLFDSVSAKNGVEVNRVDTTDLDAVAAALEPGAKALFVESPTNPLMAVSDIRALAELAHGAGALLVVDNTFLTPYFMNPISLGADVVVHSATKYLAGHNDVIAGLLVSAVPEVSERLRYLIKTIGSGLDPFAAWLVSRGIKTLPVRMERHQQNALALATWLEERPQVRYVLYPGLPDHPGHDLCLEQGRGFGGMVTFGVDSEKRALDLLRRVRLVMFAESLGGTETLITYPLTQTHADVAPEELAEKGIDGTMLRLSVGLESADDVIADLAQALA